MFQEILLSRIRHLDLYFEMDDDIELFLNATPRDLLIVVLVYVTWPVQRCQRFGG